MVFRTPIIRVTVYARLRPQRTVGIPRKAPWSWQLSEIFPWLGSLDRRMTLLEREIDYLRSLVTSWGIKQGMGMWRRPKNFYVSFLVCLGYDDTDLPAPLAWERKKDSNPTGVLYSYRSLPYPLTTLTNPTSLVSDSRQSGSALCPLYWTTIWILWYGDRCYEDTYSRSLCYDAS